MKTSLPPEGSEELDALDRRVNDIGRSVGRVLVLAGAGAVLWLLMFMVLDWQYVRSPGYPDDVEPAEAWFLLVPPAVFALSWWLGGRMGWKRTRDLVAGSVTATLLSVVGGLALILTLGMWFHFAIGGRH